MALAVSVDARPLDIENLRSQGIGRYAHGLLGPLVELAEERAADLTLIRQGNRTPNPFGPVPGKQRVVRRPPLPARAVELVEQALLPLDLTRVGADVHHSLSLYRAPLVSRARSVVTMHDVAPLQWPERYLRTGVAHRILYRAVRRAQAVLCDSHAAAADVVRLLDLDPERVTVVPAAAGPHFRPTDTTAVRAAPPGAQRTLEAADIVGVRPHDVPAEILERVIELVDRAAVELARGRRIHRRAASVRWNTSVCAA